MPAFNFSTTADLAHAGMTAWNRRCRFSSMAEVAIHPMAGRGSCRRHTLGRNQQQPPPQRRIASLSFPPFRPPESPSPGALRTFPIAVDRGLHVAAHDGDAKAINAAVFRQSSGATLRPARPPGLWRIWRDGRSPANSSTNLSPSVGLPPACVRPLRSGGHEFGRQASPRDARRATWKPPAARSPIAPGR